MKLSAMTLNPAIKQVILDGQNLSDSINYNGYGAQLDSYINDLNYSGINYTNYIFPIVKTSEEGESTGIIDIETVQPDRFGSNDADNQADDDSVQYAKDNEGNAIIATEKPYYGIGSKRRTGLYDFSFRGIYLWALCATWLRTKYIRVYQFAYNTHSCLHR